MGYKPRRGNTVRSSHGSKLFSYVVDHDNGFAPNPAGGLCTLAKCKYSKSSRANVIESAKEGDWVVGTGGAVGLARGESVGRGKLIYAMRVDQKMPLARYCREYGAKRIDAQHDIAVDGRFALVSRHFYYFGRNAPDIPQQFLEPQPLEKKGPGYRNDFSESFIKTFTAWLSCNFERGVHGSPCKPSAESAGLGCRPRLRRRSLC